MKILYFPTQNENTDTYEFLFNDDKIIVNIEFKLSGVEQRMGYTTRTKKQIEINIADYAGEIHEWCCCLAKGIYTIAEYKKMGVANRMQFINGSNKTDTHFPLFDLSTSDDKNDIVLLVRNKIAPPKCTGDIELIELDNIGTKTTMGFISDYSDFAKNLYERLLKRQECIIKHMDIYANVTYLESQVDALSRLVLKLVSEKYKDSDEVKILTEADKYSVLDVKNIDKILNEFAKDKNDVRECQKELYAK